MTCSAGQQRVRTLTSALIREALIDLRCIYYAVHVPDRQESGRRLFDTSLPSDLLELAKEVAAGDP